MAAQVKWTPQMDARILMDYAAEVPGKHTACALGVGYLAVKRRRDKLKLRKRKNYISLNLHLDPILNKQIRDLAEANGTTRGRYARQLLRNSITRELESEGP